MKAVFKYAESYSSDMKELDDLIESFPELTETIEISNGDLAEILNSISKSNFPK